VTARLGRRVDRRRVVTQGQLIVPGRQLVVRGAPAPSSAGFAPGASSASLSCTFAPGARTRRLCRTVVASGGGFQAAIASRAEPRRVSGPRRSWRSLNR
jgi:hypothetical protein